MEKSKLDFYKLFWVFTIGCVLGWAIELIWFVVKWGHFQYNQGLVYGPFLTIYGFGITILTIMCHLLKTKNKLAIFIIGFIAFGLFEHLSGWWMELLGTFAWDYTRVDYNFTIGKWVFLPYCFVWGAFAVIWYTWINKHLINFIDKVMNKKMKCLTIILAIFMSFNLLITSLATTRLTQRASNIAPSNKLDIFLDKYYNDAYMKKWMPKVRVLEK